MRGLIVIASLSCCIALAAPPAQARGCIKGALVGGVAGSYARHPVLGALAGCIAGRQIAKHPPRYPRPLGNEPAPGTRL